MIPKGNILFKNLYPFHLAVWSWMIKIQYLSKSAFFPSENIIDSISQKRFFPLILKAYFADNLMYM